LDVLLIKINKVYHVFDAVTIMLFFLHFQADCKHFETHKWFNSLIFYGWKDTSLEPPKDDDLKLVPNLVDKVILPKLTGQ